MIGIGKSEHGPAAEVGLERRFHRKIEPEADRGKWDIQAITVHHINNLEIIHIIDAALLQNVNITNQMRVVARIEMSSQPMMQPPIL